jgi:hypothetical protein
MTLPDATAIAVLQKDCPLLGDALLRMLRHDKTTLDAYFAEVAASTRVASTNTSVCCHFIQRDGNNNVRVKDLAVRLKAAIMDYAIPRTRVNDAMTHLQKTNSTVKFSQLETEAKGLFTHLKNTGEGGEMLLYMLAETVLGIPQLLCKMPLKTSSHVHYHGVDGIHATVDSKSGRLALYWGESKLHQTVGSAVSDCFESLAPFLRSAGGSTARDKRDIELLRDHVDLTDGALESAFKRYLDPDDPLHLSLEYRGVGLVGFDYKNYPDPFDPKDRKKVTGDTAAALAEWTNKVSAAVSKEKVESVVIELFCIPFPSVEDFRQAFLREMGLLSGTP